MDYSNVIIVSGHPDIEGDSVANKAALKEYERQLPGVVIDRLDALYPDYKIDVEVEQDKLRAADIIVLQYPVFWYAMPALMQKWVEDVFVHGFSHGTHGKALVGKKLILSMTIGAPEDHYAEGEAVRLDDLLIPAKGIVAATGMELAGWDYIPMVNYATRTSEEACAAISGKARELACRVSDQIRMLESELRAQ